MRNDQIHWHGKSDRTLALRAVWSASLTAVFAIGTFCAIAFWYLPMKNSDQRMTLLVVLVVLVTSFYNMVWDKWRYVDVEYIIDEWGPRAINRKTKKSWAPIPEQAGSIKVEVHHRYADVMWTEPVKSSKGGILVPAEGFRYVTDYTSMIEALDQWRERVTGQPVNSLKLSDEEVAEARADQTRERRCGGRKGSGDES